MLGDCGGDDDVGLLWCGDEVRKCMMRFVIRGEDGNMMWVKVF